MSDKRRSDALPHKGWGAETVPCGLCGTPTRMLGTKRCDRCWELEGRIQRDPALAEKILGSIQSSGETINADPQAERNIGLPRGWSLHREGEGIVVAHEQEGAVFVEERKDRSIAELILFYLADDLMDPALPRRSARSAIETSTTANPERRSSLEHSEIKPDGDEGRSREVDREGGGSTATTRGDAVGAGGAECGPRPSGGEADREDLNVAGGAVSAPSASGTRTWRVRDEHGEDLIAFWRRHAPHSNEVAAAEIIEGLEQELATAKDDRLHREKMDALYGPDGFPRSAGVAHNIMGACRAPSSTFKLAATGEWCCVGCGASNNKPECRYLRSPDSLGHE